MHRSKRPLRARKIVLIALFIASSLAVLGTYFYAYGQDKSDFPDGFDAVQAAPNSHKVIFENEFVRVLEVTVPPAGTTEPMHHHRWPSFFLDWDTGGGRPHIRYHRPDGSVRKQPWYGRANSSRYLACALDEARANACHRSRGQS